jgi:hypothetical protein
MNIILKDNRTNFNKLTFSQHNKRFVCEELLSTIYYNKIEDSLKLTAEMLASSYIKELWFIYINYYSKYIHVSNVKFPIYLNNKYNDFKEIACSMKSDLDLRNNYDIRKLFFTITYILCNLQKDNIFEYATFKLDIPNLRRQTRATSTEFVDKYYKHDDPKDYYMLINEFTYHLEKTRDKTWILYWINCIVELDAHFRKQNKSFVCSERQLPLSIPNETNIVWLLWYIIIQVSLSKSNILQKSIQSLFEIFTIKYNKNTNKKQKSLIGVAALMNYHVGDINVKLVTNMDELSTLDKHITTIFTELQKKQIFEQPIKTEKELLFDSIYK